MLLDRLTLHNFSVYKGRQVVDLAPPSKDRPVILFGGMNGSGKTTLLDALQLVLYGKLADCSNRRDLSYEEFLRRSINRSVDPREGAAIELEFRHHTEGREQIYRVHRSWSGNGSGQSVRERVEVVRNGAIDPVITEAWAEHVEEFIPQRLSGFLFFDAEKIEGLADLERSADVLSSAIRSLLGLDLVDQLQTDLKVVERRKRERQRSDDARARVEAVRVSFEEQQARYKDLLQSKASHKNKLDRAGKAAQTAEDRFRRAGGEAYEKRAAVEAKRTEVRTKLKSVHERLDRLSAAASPLLLVLDRVRALSGEQQSFSAPDDNVIRFLESRDAAVVAWVKQSGSQGEFVRRLTKFLQSDRREIAARAAEAKPGKMDNITRRGVRSLLDEGLPDARAEAGVLLAEAEKLASELERLDRALASSPDKDSVASLADGREDAVSELRRAEGAYHAVSEELERAQREKDRRWEAYTKLIERDVDDHFRDEDADRIVRHSAAVRGVLDAFRVKVVERHIRRIEALILDGFRNLLRKKAMVEDIRIDASTYRITLFGAGGTPLAPERLSAGERQLLAVSIIWALARAAGRPLPVVIDTPLGRLDSLHRDHMLRRYFPVASHQVLLLSTDMEVDASELKKLRPSIGRSYKLTYDDREQSSKIEPGYFWEDVV
jgi:DNA sulfur modification protein DndD